MIINAYIININIIFICLLLDFKYKALKRELYIFTIENIKFHFSK